MRQCSHGTQRCTQASQDAAQLNSAHARLNTLNSSVKAHISTQGRALRSMNQGPASTRARSGRRRTISLCTLMLLLQLLRPPSLALCRHSSAAARKSQS